LNKIKIVKINTGEWRLANQVAHKSKKSFRYAGFEGECHSLEHWKSAISWPLYVACKVIS